MAGIKRFLESLESRKQQKWEFQMLDETRASKDFRSLRDSVIFPASSRKCNGHLQFQGMGHGKFAARNLIRKKYIQEALRIHTEAFNIHTKVTATMRLQFTGPWPPQSSLERRSSCDSINSFLNVAGGPVLGLPHLEVSNSFPMTAYAMSRRSFNRKGANVISSHSPASMILNLLDVYEDEYDGVIIDPEFLPSSTNAFVANLRTSLSYWKLEGKKGVWLKILLEQAHLVPVAIKEGFNYHHAEPGYVMLTFWIPKEPCMLPANASHQVGVGGFVITEKSEVLVVKERKCPCRCSGIWKLPTGFIDKSEELFTGAIREVKEETGIETDFLEVIAFRHAHCVAFDKSDLLFFCMLKPLSFDINIDEAEIEDAKWMPLDEFLGQPYYQEDQMLKKATEICVARYENRYSGFIAHQLISKFDGRLSYLYSND